MRPLASTRIKSHLCTGLVNLRTMKQLLILLIWILPAGLQAQKSDTLLRYFTPSFDPTNTAEGSYQGKVFPEQTGWGVIVEGAQGKVLMRGAYRDKSLRIKDGLFTYYYPEGGKLVQGTYQSNRNAGIWLSWHPSGQLKDSVAFANGVKNGMSRGYHPNGQMMHQGYYVAGYADSTWDWMYPNGKYSTREKYTLGKLQRLECYDSTGVMTGDNCNIEVPPTIQGRYGGIQKYITDSLYYPKEALEKNIQGIVAVEFTITKEGQLKNIRILNSPDKLLSDEVIRLLNSVPAWYPAVMHNQVMDNTQQFRIPFYKPGTE